MKASPLILFLCLGVAPAQAGSPFGGVPAPMAGPHGHFGAGHGHFGGRHAVAPFFVNAVSDIEPGPVPPPPYRAPPPPEPETYAPPPEPVYLPSPCVPLPPPLRMHRSGPQILYLRKPPKRPGPVVIYGAG